MIYFVGDLHADFSRLVRLKDYITKYDTVIQVGDFGFYPERIDDLKKYYLPEGYPCKVLAIDGNHEKFTYLYDMIEGDGLFEFHPNMFYVPRGTVMEIEGYLIGFLGGAHSVDIGWRKPSGTWYVEEEITEENLQTLIDNVDGRQLDILVTHAAPPTTIRENFSPLNHDYWRLPHDWVDHSSNRVEEAMNILNPKRVVCGHMHKSVSHENVRILDINEVIIVDDLDL